MTTTIPRQPLPLYRRVIMLGNSPFLAFFDYLLPSVHNGFFVHLRRRCAPSSGTNIIFIRRILYIITMIYINDENCTSFIAPGRHIVKIIVEKFPRLRRDNLSYVKKLRFFIEQKTFFFCVWKSFCATCPRFVPRVLVLCSITSFCAQ